MSKKYNFSIDKDEVFNLEMASKKSGLPVISVIRERYEKGKTAIEFEDKINKLESEILSLKNDLKEFQNSLADSLSLIGKKASFCYDYSWVSLKHRPKYIENPEEYKKTLSAFESRAESFFNIIKKIFKKDLNTSEINV